MIDFAGLVGRFTGKNRLDGAQTGANPAAGADAGIATGGKFAALVNLAAQVVKDSDQTGPRLVVDNGAGGVDAGGTGMNDAGGIDAAMAGTAESLSAGDGVTPVTDPGMSGTTAAGRGVVKDHFTMPRPIDVANGPTVSDQGAVAVDAIPADGEETVMRADADAPSDDERDIAMDAFTSDEAQPASTLAGQAVAQIAAMPQPAMINPAINPAPAAIPSVAPPPFEPDAPSPAGMASTVTVSTGTAAKGGSDPAAPMAPVAGKSPTKKADQAVRTVADMPVAEGTEQALPEATRTAFAIPAQPGLDAARQAGLDAPVATQPQAVTTLTAVTAPGDALAVPTRLDVPAVDVATSSPVAPTPAVQQAVPVTDTASARQPLPVGLVATMPQSVPARPVAPVMMVQDSAPVPVAPVVTVTAPALPGAVSPGTASDEDSLPMAERASITRVSLALANLPAALRPRMASRAGSADAAATPIATVATPSIAPRGDEIAYPTAGAVAKSTAASAAPASDATAASGPLRAIVDSLPPVIQSELSTPAVSAATGPTTGQALGDKVIDMGVSGQWIDRMAREIASLSDGTGHSRFTLNPPHLGRLQVDLWRDQGATNVRLMTETDAAAQRLNDGRQALQSDARVTALGFGTITVEKAATPFDSGRDQQRPASDQSGQAQQQAGGGPAQGRAGNGGNGGQGQTSDWVRRVAQDDANKPSDATARAPAERAANGRVRFA